MPAHVFVAWSDLKSVTCDAWLVPGGRGAGRVWRQALPKGWRYASRTDSGHRATVILDADNALPTPLPVLTDISGDGAQGASWYVDGARAFLREAAHALRTSQRPPLHGRARYLLALPLLGTDGGGGGALSGEITSLLLPALREEAERLEEAGAVGVDVALVLIEGPAWAAAQRQRATDRQAFAALPSSLIAHADALAERARSGGLTIFIGAGVARPAGLPDWKQLLHLLAEQHITDDEFSRQGSECIDEFGRGAPELMGGEVSPPAPQETRLGDTPHSEMLFEARLRDFDSLNELDRAAWIERRLVGETIGEATARVVIAHSHRFALSHALLASLPVSEVVTTNYDDLFERASNVVGRPCARIPGQVVAAGERFILKMHGCVTQPSSIVLTRGDYLRFQENRSALSGIVQALMLTRHMLFVGFSFTDDNFHRIAHAVRSAVRGDSTEPRSPFGTNLVVGGGKLVADLWRDDLDWLSFSANGASLAEQARLVEIFLDRLSAQATTITSHLGNDRWLGALSSGELALRHRLEGLVASASDDERSTPAWAEIDVVLQRLGIRRRQP
jgi:hypothetical protein